DGLNTVEPRFRYHLLAPRKTEADLTNPERLWWDQVEFPRRAHQVKADLIHQPAFSVPMLTNKKIVVTVHDLIVRLFPKDVRSPWSRVYFGWWMPLSYRRADHLIAISAYTKRDIERELGIPQEKITVIYEAAGAKYQPTADQTVLKQVKKHYDLPGRYLLHIGTLNPRKNIQFLIEVFAKLLGFQPDLTLVIAGKQNWFYPTLKQQVETLGIAARVRFTGYIDETDKACLLQGAELLVFPSLYEGFGLPPLEAMAIGTPVVASNRTSIPEVVGRAGVLLEPDDHAGWVTAIRQILDNRRYHDQLRDRGFRQAAQFTWEETARKTAEVYHYVLGLR
ncbi:glycosyltransferase family 4 protein, partial [Candidatus Berkelbacteria bacterium]|nr:glycosyltransferase family 4 protein [Candidatus Berkelbacteria bacterium]